MCFFFWEGSAALWTPSRSSWTIRRPSKNANKRSFLQVSKSQGHTKQPTNITFPSARHTWICDVCNYVFHDKLTVHQLVKKFPIFCEIRRFITAFTTAPTCPYPQPHNPVHASSSHILKKHFNIISPSTQKLCYLTLRDSAFYPDGEYS